MLYIEVAIFPASAMHIQAPCNLLEVKAYYHGVHTIEAYLESPANYNIKHTTSIYPLRQCSS